MLLETRACPAATEIHLGQVLLFFSWLKCVFCKAGKLGRKHVIKQLALGCVCPRKHLSSLTGEKGHFLWNICRRSFNVRHVDVQDVLLRYSAAFLNYKLLLEDCPGISYDGFAGRLGTISRVSC